MYTVLEIQTFPDGTMVTREVPDKGHDPEKTDEENKNEAFSEYFGILRYAAISTLPSHAAVILSSDGEQIAGQCFKH